MEEFSIRGEWFLPGNSNVSHGELSFSEDGILLRLSSWLPGSLIYAFVEFEIIHGISNTGEKITLLNNWPNEINTIKSNTVLRGMHLDNKDELIFHEFTFESQLLNNIIGITGFKKVNNNYNSAEIHYQLPEDIKFNINNIGTGVWVFNYDNSTINKPFDISCVQKISLQIKFNDLLSYEKLFEHFDAFFQFLTFVCQNTPSIEALFFHVIPKNEQEEFVEGNKIQILFTENRLNKIKKEDFVNIENGFLFKLKDVDNFDSKISKWFELDKVIEPSLNILFETFLKDYSFNENSFLNQCQALELLHRRLYNIKESDLRLHDKRLKEILDSIEDTSYKKWLSEKLNYSHEPSLRKRLRELFLEIDKVEIVKRINPDKDFIESVVNNRNYYTHYDTTLPKGALKNKQLWKLTIKLKILLIIIILKRMGFDDTFLNSNSISNLSSRYLFAFK